MRLEKASHKAIKYACMKFHYAKAIPIISTGFSVFNDNNEWCGCITFGGGASPNLGKMFGIRAGEYLELTRMALNGKQESTSKAMSIAMRLIKKKSPTVRLLISYADVGQNHIGIIYQATNWIFIDQSKSSGTDVFYKGKWRHDRNIPKAVFQKCEKRIRAGKRKYIYPLDKDMKTFCNELAKPYPKKEV
jgi:hypothetical protein